MSDLTSPRGLVLRGWLPAPIYDRSRLVAALMQGEGAEFDALRLALAETVDQWFVSTATWGLDRWESELGLTPLPEATFAQRRESVMARRVGVGTATVKQIKAVASSYAGGEIDVVEDFSAYVLYITFVAIGGVPDNVLDLQDAVRAIVPANLSIEYVYRYLLVRELTDTGLTVDDVTALALTVDELAQWSPP